MNHAGQPNILIYELLPEPASVKVADHSKSTDLGSIASIIKKLPKDQTTSVHLKAAGNYTFKDNFSIPSRVNLVIHEGAQIEIEPQQFDKKTWKWLRFHLPSNYLFVNYFSPHWV